MVERDSWWLTRPYPHAVGIAALCYILWDYSRVVWPGLHATLRPVLWGFLAVALLARAPFYPHWGKELRSVVPFLASLLFMLAALCVEATAVQFVTVVMGVDWHWTAPPLPDTGQWLLLALNQKLPAAVVQVLRAPIIGLHHYLMLFLMLAFSVLFGCVKAPGLGLGARYMFTMGVGRLLRVATFVATILPSARPWCAYSRFKSAGHPHPWAQKYYMPYASDPNMVRELLRLDDSYAPVGEYPAEYVPNWGGMQFLVNILRPPDPAIHGESESWFSTLKRAGGGCNDLVFSGHILVSVLTAMAWTEAYPGWYSVCIWLLVLHSSQREIRERHHYSVDCVAGIYVGILLWRTTSFLWSHKDKLQSERLQRLAAMEESLVKAAKDGDVEQIRTCLRKLDERSKSDQVSKWASWVLGSFIVLMALGIALLAFTWTEDG